MNSNNDNLISMLFETKAINVCKANKPFFYTSGTIGPYYINTHYLYGGENIANDLLNFIDSEKTDILAFPIKLEEKVLLQYNQNSIYRNVIDEMYRFICDNIPLDQIEYISGGERRDWFFSIILARLLGKPHICIYKDLTMVITNSGEKEENKTNTIGIKLEDGDTLKYKGILHIADLITEASSYEEKWIPAVNTKGGQIKWSIAVVDRNQGGQQKLESKGIQSCCMVKVDEGLFCQAEEQKLINVDQLSMIIGYMNDPRRAMSEFLVKNPDFLEQALSSPDNKIRERAELCKVNMNLMDC